MSPEAYQPLSTAERITVIGVRRRVEFAVNVSGVADSVPVACVVPLIKHALVAIQRGNLVQRRADKRIRCRTRDQVKVVSSDHCPKVYANVRRRCVLTFAAQRTSARPGKVIHRQVRIRIDIGGIELPGVRSHAVDCVVSDILIIRQSPLWHEQDGQNRDDCSNTTKGQARDFSGFIFPPVQRLSYLTSHAGPDSLVVKTSFGGQRSAPYGSGEPEMRQLGTYLGPCAKVIDGSSSPPRKAHTPLDISPRHIRRERTLRQDRRCTSSLR